MKLMIDVETMSFDQLMGCLEMNLKKEERVRVKAIIRDLLKDRNCFTPDESRFYSRELKQK